MTPTELIQAACPTIGTVGSAFYFAPETLAKGKELGLDGMRWYVVGRAGVLGDVDASVVTSAFGWWHPGVIAKLWNTAKEKVAPREAGHLYHLAAADFGRAKFADVEGLEAYNAAAEKVIAAAHPAALALFAGIAAEPLVDDAPGRAMQLTAVLREFRGSAHIVAVLAAGGSPELAHFAKRPEMYKAFGYDEASPPKVTDADRAKFDAAEALTDQLVLPAFSALDAAEADALAAGVAGLKAALG